MHFYVILKSLPISDDRGPSSFEGTSTVLRLKFMYVSSFDSINIRTRKENTQKEHTKKRGLEAVSEFNLNHIHTPTG